MDAIKQIISVFGMLVIFVLVLYGSYVCSKKVAKMSFKNSQSHYMKLEDQLTLGQDKFIAVVSINGMNYLIGVTNNGISLLSELGEASLKELDSPVQSFTPNVSFQEILKKLGKDK